ncbi:MAG: hypothetical protein GY747_13755 [Planctomycetes bacterium]|nr:hypothetical protein [Planctomycetota bacterium]MCP4772394.1 hypothetical protein [Planctomycetota bacterium]MCP4861506.1 hypothetical protein [Planctomycetota bacterium]
MKTPSILLTFAALAFGSSSAAAQTTHQVDLVGASFSPAHITIQEGDTVHWNWVSGLHNVDSDDGLFNSGFPMSPPFSYSLTFDAAFLASAPANGNYYGYHCDPHLAFGMVGSVTVQTNNPVLQVDNLLAGQQAQLIVRHATPGAAVGFAYSVTGPGPTTLTAGPCGLLTASLSAPVKVLPQFVTANGSGVAVLPVNVPPAAVDVYIWLQALDLGNCELSNGATMRVGL